SASRVGPSGAGSTFPSWKPETWPPATAKECNAMSKAGKRILAGAREARAFVRGEIADGFKVHVPKSIDARAVREKAGLSQEQFALRIGVPLGTLRNWGQKRRAPDGPARVLLAVLERSPTVVEEALGEAA